MKKLIEVALPLEEINKASAREKSIRHGHPSTLHLWWARRPLAACRAVLFSSLVDDPGEYIEDEAKAHAERERLFDLITKLVQWENSNNETVLDEARLEIARSVARNLNVDLPIGKEAVREFLATKAPPVLDPFAGGGSIPLEAQRLGLRAYASDLNPVAVLINKALIEIPPRFANMPPVHPSEDVIANSVKQSPRGGNVIASATPSSRTKQSQRADEEIASSDKDHPLAMTSATQLRLEKREWQGAAGLAEDVRFYGKWMRDEAEKRIGHLYPKVSVIRNSNGSYHQATTQEIENRNSKIENLTVIAWLWARTVKCPNPACGAMMPLVRSFELSKKKGKQAWVEPIVDENNKTVQFEIRTTLTHGAPSKNIELGTSLINDRGKKVKATFKCVVCNAGIAKGDYIDNEANAGRMLEMPLAIVAQSSSGRVYIHFSKSQAQTVNTEPLTHLKDSGLEAQIPNEPARGTFASNAQGRIYGFKTFAEYFTNRQLVALLTFNLLVENVWGRVLTDSIASGMTESDAKAYAEAVSLYLGLAACKLADRNSTLVSWDVGSDSVRSTFARQAIPMMWDFCETNPFAEMGSIEGAIDWIYRLLPLLPSMPKGIVKQVDISASIIDSIRPVLSTDPPYYGNVAYADLADYFYVWLRRGIGKFYPDLFTTVLTPKSSEITATPFRFDGNRHDAQKFFEENLGKAFARMRQRAIREYPLTVYYAFKQTEDNDEAKDETSMSSTGWETMLDALISTGFQITGTWPMRTELKNRPVASGTNALTSSIVLVCRPRPEDAPRATRREFLAALKRELPPALRELQQGNIAPVDLAQAAIGPGMAIFSKYREVLEPDGAAMRVRTALALINQALDEYLTEQEGEYDADTRWALAWFEQYGHEAGPFGVAETLSKAKNTGIDGLVRAGILASRGGHVHLLKRDELPATWDPRADARLTAWESVQYLVRALDLEGEAAAALLLKQLGAHAETARDLAYRLYTLCERKGWAQDALGYNMLVVAWARLVELGARERVEQGALM